MHALSAFCVQQNFCSSEDVLCMHLAHARWKARGHLKIRVAAEPCKVVGQLDEVGQQACIGLAAAPSALCGQGVAVGKALQQAGHAPHNGPHLHPGILAG